MSELWIVIPVKDTRFSKQRLAGVLSAHERQMLAHAMLEDVLDAVVAVEERAPCALVTIDPFARGLAARHGFRVIEAGAHDGHTGAVDGGREVLAREGAEGILTMPGDIPLVTAGDIAAVLDAHAEGRGFTIAPAHDRQGSNAVACSPPTAVPLRFGADSFYPHLDAARAAGLAPVVVERDGIATDVDTPEDASRLLARDPARRSRAARLLDQFRWCEREHGPRAAVAEVTP